MDCILTTLGQFLRMRDEFQEPIASLYTKQKYRVIIATIP